MKVLSYDDPNPSNPLYDLRGYLTAIIYTPRVAPAATKNLCTSSPTDTPFPVVLFDGRGRVRSYFIAECLVVQNARPDQSCYSIFTATYSSMRKLEGERVNAAVLSCNHQHCTTGILSRYQYAVLLSDTPSVSAPLCALRQHLKCLVP
jgi:hypothetical protein